MCGRRTEWFFTMGDLRILEKDAGMNSRKCRALAWKSMQNDAA
uniref:Uncharacterized protein n=1 Tax=Arundo donax TaxID=35708 RepID=A0A0A9FH69_ARUDO